MSTPAGTNKSNGPDKDEPKDDKTDYTIAKAAGAVIAAGIAWSVFRTIWPKKADEDYATYGDDVSRDGDTQTYEEKTEGFAEKVSKKFPKFSRKKGQGYEVCLGDTLYGLSRKYGVSVESIKAANGISGDIIVVGEKLNIPG